MSEQKERRSVIIRENPYRPSKKRTREACNSSDETGAIAPQEQPQPSNSESSVSNAPPASTSSSAQPLATTTQTATALVIAAADKAGMDGIDRDRINAIILRESGNSLYMQQQRKRDQQVDQRITAMKQKQQQQQATAAQDLNGVLDLQMSEWIAQRPNRSVCVVVDMDMFYMACELLTRPALHQRPACVGGGMILTSNYPARRYGVRSAMAGWIGDALVRELSEGREELVHVPANFALYTIKSNQVREVLAEYDPTHLRAYSLDEAFLNLGPYLALKLVTRGEWTHERIRDTLLRQQQQHEGNAKKNKGSSNCSQVAEKPIQDEVGQVESRPDETTVHKHRKQSKGGDDDDDDSSCCSISLSNDTEQELADEYSCSNYETILTSYEPAVCMQEAATILTDLRRRVQQRTGGLTCSAGLAPNTLLAKIASDCNKPDGQCLVPSDQRAVCAFLHPLPIRKVSGIGRVTEKMLQAFGIQTVQQLYEQRALVAQLFTPVQAKNLLMASVGCSSSEDRVAPQEDLSGEPAASNGNDIVGQKGISRERTFRPGKSWVEINSKLEDIAHLLASDMQRKGIWARTITVKVKLHTFDVFSRAQSLENGVFVQSAAAIVEAAAELLAKIRNEFVRERTRGAVFSVRLLGIRCSNFRSEQVADAGGANQTNMEAFLQQQQPDKTSCKQQQNISPYSKGFAQASPLPETSKPKLLFDPSVIAFDRKKAPVVKLPTSVVAAALKTPRVACPVCGQSFPETDNVALNRHIDACLSGNAVRQAVREESQRSRTPHSKQRLTDYFSVTASDRKPALT